MKNRYEKIPLVVGGGLLIVCALIFLLFYLLFLTSCTPSKSLAQQCAEAYPCKADTNWITIEVLDSFEVKGDSIMVAFQADCPDGSTVTGTAATVTPSKVIYKTRTVTLPAVTIIDSALVTMLRQKLAQNEIDRIASKKVIDLLKKQTESSPWLMILVMGLIGLIMFYITRKTQQQL